MLDDIVPTTLPLDEQTRLLRQDSDRLDIAERELAAARRAYEAHVVNGVNADIAEVRERLEEQYGGALREAEEAATKLAEAVGSRARGVKTATQTARAKLSGGELVEAGAFAPFAEAACRDLAIRDLVSEIRSAVVGNDRAKMFAYSRFLPKRLAPAASEIGNFRPDPAAREKAELKRLLGVIAERLADPAFEPVNRRATDLLMRAGAVERDASKRQQEEYRRTHLFPFQTEGDVKRWDN